MTDRRAELCKTCVHTNVCMKDKNLFGDTFISGHPVFFDNGVLYQKYLEQKAAGFPCKDYLKSTEQINEGSEK